MTQLVNMTEIALATSKMEEKWVNDFLLLSSFYKAVCIANYIIAACYWHFVSCLSLLGDAAELEMVIR